MNKNQINQFIESIGSSTRIKGATLSNEEVKDVLNEVKIRVFKTREEQEVYGYYEVLNLALDSYDFIKLKENHIYHLHKLLEILPILSKKGTNELQSIYPLQPRYLRSRRNDPSQPIV